MNDNFSGLMKAFESGRIDRRRLMQALGVTAATALAASVSPEAAAFAAGGAQVAGMGRRSDAQSGGLQSHQLSSH